MQQQPPFPVPQMHSLTPIPTSSPPAGLQPLQMKVVMSMKTTTVLWTPVPGDNPLYYVSSKDMHTTICTLLLV